MSPERVDPSELTGNQNDYAGHANKPQVMNPTQIEHLTTTLQHEFGTGLRTVAIGYPESREYEIRYIRDDIAAQYDEADRENIFGERLCEYLDTQRQDERCASLGELQLTIRTFEQGIHIVVWYDETMLFLEFGPDETVVPPAIRVCHTLRDDET